VLGTPPNSPEIAIAEWPTTCNELKSVKWSLRQWSRLVEVWYTSMWTTDAILAIRTHDMLIRKHVCNCTLYPLYHEPIKSTSSVRKIWTELDSLPSTLFELYYEQSNLELAELNLYLSIKYYLIMLEVSKQVTEW